MDWLVVAIAAGIVLSAACAILLLRSRRSGSATTGLDQDALVRAVRRALRARGWKLHKGWFTADMVVTHPRFGQRAILCKAGHGTVTPLFIGNASAHFRTAKQPLALIAGEDVPAAIKDLAETRNTVILGLGELDRLQDWPALSRASVPHTQPAPQPVQEATRPEIRVGAS